MDKEDVACVHEYYMYICVCVCVCVYIYKMDYYSAIIKNEIIPFVAHCWT